ncbi:MAG TPA: hypothetical protein VFS83_08495 [Ktedonobacterales bacterium]|nr:hypothetical protein [Ktedonobacterales bacterium]
MDWNVSSTSIETNRSPPTNACAGLTHHHCELSQQRRDCPIVAALVLRERGLRIQATGVVLALLAIPLIST